MKMLKQSSGKPLKWLPGTNLPGLLLCPLFFTSLLILIILGSTIYFPRNVYPSAAEIYKQQPLLPLSFHSQISNLQMEVGMLLEQIHSDTQEAKALAKFSDQVIHIAVALDKLATCVSHHISNLPANATEMSHIDEDSSDPEEPEEDASDEFIGNHAFKAGELKNYTLPKPNRIAGKKTFFGVEAVNPSIGMACAAMASNLDRFMSYKLFGTCPDDWDLAQKLMISGCDPLPRRRCFSRTPLSYSKPIPSSISLWTQPRDVNILWSHYKCKDYQCLLSNQTMNKRGFFKCSDCFDLSRRGWEVPANESESAEFTIDQVLALKPGDIRVGLDFGPSTGSFAALMWERNVTVATATLNLGAPFNEVIALRGLLPLYVSVSSRLPFFDNTLDIVHSSLFLDGWIGTELLQFVLFDWDRVLRPLGLLWVDRFFCKKEDVKMYVGEFERLRYRKLLWRAVPKSDKSEDEVFLSAVLEKPVRT